MFTYKNNNKQSVNLSTKITNKQHNNTTILTNNDITQIQSLAIILGNISCDGNQKQQRIRQKINKNKNINVIENKQMNYNGYRKEIVKQSQLKSKKIGINQLLKQFGQNNISQQVIELNKKTAYFKQSNQVLPSSPSKNVIKKLPLRSQTKYSQNSPNSKSITAFYQNTNKQNRKSPSNYTIKQTTPTSYNNSIPQHHTHIQNQSKFQEQQKNTTNLRQSTVTFSPLRIDISLPSLCSEDLDQIKQQRQIISEIQKDINLLINKIKANHFDESPKMNHVKINMHINDGINGIKNKNNNNNNKSYQNMYRQKQHSKSKDKDLFKDKGKGYQKYQRNQHRLTKISKR